LSFCYSQSFFSVHHYFEKTCVILVDGNLDPIIRLIRSWGVAAPLPAFLVAAANGMIFGHFWMIVLPWAGAPTGALTWFYIAGL
jgi:hypothetical protein